MHYKQCLPKFFPKNFHAKKMTYYNPKSFFTRCTVLTLTPQIAAVSRIDLPARSERITLPYSSCLRSLDLTLPTLRPNLPPSAMYFVRPELRRKTIFSRSIWAQTPSTDTITARYGFSLPSVPNNDKPSFWK